MMVADPPTSSEPVAAGASIDPPPAVPRQPHDAPPPGPAASFQPVAASPQAMTVQVGSITALPEPSGATRPPGPTQPTGERHGTCTTAQLRRFIKSRAYLPIHEIRRRFLILAEDDDVTGIDLPTGRIFVGLPEREGQMLGELLRAGEAGYELQLDPVSPIVVGVYPMRPVTRG